MRDSLLFLQTLNTFTRRKAVAACSVLLILVTSLYSWFGTVIKAVTLEGQLVSHCRPDFTGSNAAVGFYYFSSIVSVICPVVILLLLNTTIIIQLRRTLNMNLIVNNPPSISSKSSVMSSTSSHHHERRRKQGFK